MQSRQPWKRDHKLTLASIMLAALALLWSVGIYFIERPSEQLEIFDADRERPSEQLVVFDADRERPSEQLVVFFADSAKRPKIDIALVGPKAETIYPDSRGMLLVSRSWAGKNIRVHERSTWRLITTIRLQDAGDEP